MKRQILVSLALLAVCQSYAASDSLTNDTKQLTPLILEYSFLDFPFATYAGKTVNSSIADPGAKSSLFTGMRYKSMQQSTQIYTGITQSINWGIKNILVFKRRSVLQKLTHNIISGAIELTISRKIPYTLGWAHEEFHRSVMVTNYTNSFNPLGFSKGDFDISGNLVSVGMVLDTNLVLMKKNDNPTFIRLATAGLESQVYGVQRMQQQNFFYQQDLPYSVHYISSLFNVFGYIAGSVIETTETEINKTIAKEGNNQPIRDFTGFDPLSWCYDLNHPDEPYSARGLHPYGNGYDRYIRPSDLADEQITWLERQASLSMLNLISPMNFMVSSITLKRYEDGNTLKGNFSFRYFPTSFGATMGIDLLVKTPEYNIFLAPHFNRNYKNYFPGIEIMLFEYPVQAFGQKLLTTVDVIADMQPASQSFFTSKSRFAGYINANLKWKASKILYPFVSVNGKTYGWVKGDPFIKSRAGFEVGLSARVNY